MKNNNRFLLKRILGYTKKYRFLLFISFMSAILYVSATLLAPIVIGKAIDEFKDVDTFDISLILPYVWFLLGVVVLGALFGWVMNSLLNKIT
ncbi:MAG: hypothetical protein K2G50_03555, partial [Anaeroplasmataceae bacterium]|nr:hypothetical protein [Anaeroplasmataceae bacterium]